MIKCEQCVDELSQLTDKQKKKDYSLVKNYGITYPEYYEILRLQDHKCFMCRRSPVNLSLSVDHKHKKGEKKEDLRLRRARVRGLLCYPCNKALGVLRDDVSAMANGVIYLSQWPAQAVLEK